MAITISGDGITSANIADSAITSTKIADGTITNADINATANIAQSKTATLVSSDMPAGSVLQTVHYSYGYDSTTITVNSTTATATGIAKTVTPKSNNSTFLVWITLNIDSSVRYELSMYKNGANVITYGSSSHFAMGNNSGTSNGHHQINGFAKSINSGISDLTFEVYAENAGSGDSYTINTHTWGENALVIMEVQN